MARITIRLPDELDEEVEDHIGYAHKSDFYRKAAREMLDREADREATDDDEDVAEQTAD